MRLPDLEASLGVNARIKAVRGGGIPQRILVSARPQAQGGLGSRRLTNAADHEAAVMVPFQRRKSQ